MDKPRILILYTGGTIGMKKTRHGYQPVPGYLQELMRQIPQFRAREVPEFEILQFDPLLDSSNTTPADWVSIARRVEENYERYDAFLVLHGTDTMAFTSSALSFMLGEPAKPVVVTGSQIPLAETRSDAQENLLTSLILLGSYGARLPGVFLFFNNRLFRGNRATKVNADGFDAFASPNLPPVATVGIDFDIDWDLVRPASERPLELVEIGRARVATFQLFPGMHASYVEALLAAPVQALVLQCFGAGNAPDKNRPFMEALRAATSPPRDVVVVATTLPLVGSANLELYATGRALADAGVVSGYDMTTEAALAKLFYLFELGLEPARVKVEVQRDLRGELTPPEDEAAALEKVRRQLAGGARLDVV